MTVHTYAVLLASGDIADFTSVNDFARRTTWLHGAIVTYAGGESRCSRCCCSSATCSHAPLGGR